MQTRVGVLTKILVHHSRIPCPVLPTESAAFLQLPTWYNAIVTKVTTVDRSVENVQKVLLAIQNVYFSQRV